MDEPEASHRRGLRQLLEDDLRALVESGIVPATGDREIVIRLDRDGFIRWLTVTRVRMPAGELETQ